MGAILHEKKHQPASSCRLDSRAEEEGLAMVVEGRVHGLSLLEVVIALAILSIMAGVGIPAIKGSHQDADAKALQAEARTLNDAIYRVQTSGKGSEWMALSNILYLQEDKNEAVRWLVERGYVRQTK